MTEYLPIHVNLRCAQMETVVVLMQEAEEARAAADAKLDAVMAALGFEGWREVAIDG